MKELSTIAVDLNNFSLLFKAITWLDIGIFWGKFQQLKKILLGIPMFMSYGGC